MSLEFFVRVLFLRNFPHMRSFMTIKSLQNVETTLSLIDKGKSCLVTNFEFREYVNTIREKMIITKHFDFTVKIDTRAILHRFQIGFMFIFSGCTKQPIELHMHTCMNRINLFVLQNVSIYLGDNCIQNFHLRRYIVGYTV